MPADRPETCPTCGVGEPWNRYSYKTTDGDGRPLIVYTESAGDGDRDECADSWHDDDLADRILAQAKDPASPLSKALWHTPTPPAPADDAGRVVVKSPRPCPDCDGAGWLAGDPCPLCSGLAPGEREDTRLKHQRAVEKERAVEKARRAALRAKGGARG